MVRTEGAASYVYARKVEAGKPTAEVLARRAAAGDRQDVFEKTMRWNASNVPFARPVNWIAALLGDT